VSASATVSIEHDSEVLVIGEFRRGLTRIVLRSIWIVSAPILWILDSSSRREAWFINDTNDYDLQFVRFGVARDDSYGVDQDQPEFSGTMRSIRTDWHSAVTQISWTSVCHSQIPWRFRRHDDLRRLRAESSPISASVSLRARVKVSHACGTHARGTTVVEVRGAPEPS
jgi:hypothetical protein